MIKREEQIHIALATWMKYQYPKVIFTSESSGIRVSMVVAIKMKKQRSVGCLPDMIVLEPKGCYHGLCLEIKKNWEEIHLKNGQLRQSEHIQEQNDMLIRLGQKGYYARFGCGLDECKKIVETYMAF